MKKVIAVCTTALLAIGLGVSGASLALASTTDGPTVQTEELVVPLEEGVAAVAKEPKAEKLAICHSGNGKNWTFIEPDANGYNGHQNHDADVYGLTEAECDAKNTPEPEPTPVSDDCVGPTAKIQYAWNGAGVFTATVKTAGCSTGESLPTSSYTLDQSAENNSTVFGTSNPTSVPQTLFEHGERLVLPATTVKVEAGTVFSATVAVPECGDYQADLYRGELVDTVGIGGHAGYIAGGIVLQDECPPVTVEECDTLTAGSQFTNENTPAPGVSPLYQWTLTGGGTAEWVDGGLAINANGGKSNLQIFNITPFDLKNAGTPSLDYTNTGGAYDAGLNLVIALDGAWAGTLVYEPAVYGEGVWWNTRATSEFAKNSYFTLNEFLAKHPTAQVIGLGYALNGDSSGIVHGFTAGCKTYTFDRTDAPSTPPTYTEWVIGEYDCDDTQVTESREVTTTTYSFVGGQWVAGTPVVTSESQTRNLTEAEIKAKSDSEECAVVIIPEPPVDVPSTDVPAALTGGTSGSDFAPAAVIIGFLLLVIAGAATIAAMRKRGEKVDDQ